MTKVFSNSRRRLLAGMVAAGLAGPGALAQKALAQNAAASGDTLGPCKASKRLTGLTEPATLYTSLFNDKINQIVYIDPTYERRPEPADVTSPQAIFHSPGSDKAWIGLRHPSFSRLLKGHYRWRNGMDSHSHIEIKENAKLLAPPFVFPEDGARMGSLEISLWYAGSDLAGRADEVYSFDIFAFTQAIASAPGEDAAVRASAQARQCDQTQSPGCFLTTAAVELIGLPDDCWELTALRKFRDRWLAAQPGGAAQIAQYQRRAPAIAAQLLDDPRRLARLYYSGILPAALAARLGLNRLARALYVRKMLGLADLG